MPSSSASEPWKCQTSTKELKLLWGKRSVLVYAGTTKDEMGDPIPYSFLFTVDAEEYHIDPIVFVRLNHEWVVW